MPNGIPMSVPWHWGRSAGWGVVAGRQLGPGAASGSGLSNFADSGGMHYSFNYGYVSQGSPCFRHLITEITWTKVQQISQTRCEFISVRMHKIIWSVVYKGRYMTERKEYPISSYLEQLMCCAGAQALAVRGAARSSLWHFLRFQL